jgi:hypothetical protein
VDVSVDEGEDVAVNVSVGGRIGVLVKIGAEVKVGVEVGVGVAMPSSPHFRMRIKRSFESITLS